jgi:uncharacterized protein (DUF608 family)
MKTLLSLGRSKIILGLTLALAASLGVQAAADQVGKDLLFPADLPTAKWTQFPAEGFAAPVTGVIYQDTAPPCCGVPLGGVGTGCIDLDARGSWGFNSLFGLLYPEKAFAGTRGNIFEAPLTRKLPDYQPVLGVSVGERLWVLQPRELLDGGTLPTCVDPVFIARKEAVNLPALRNTLAATRISYWGHYPVADTEFELEAPAADQPAPLSVGLRAWAPFLPGDVENSSTPCAFFEVQLRNDSKEPQKGALLFNFPGIVPPPSGGNLTFTRSAIAGDAWQGVAVEDGTRGYVLGVVDSTTAQFGAGLARDEAAWLAAGAGHLPEAGTQAGGASARVEFDLPAGGVKKLEFVVAWHVKSQAGRGENRYTPMYAKRFANAAAVARQMVPAREALLRRVLAWQQVVYDDAALPGWLKDSLVNNLALIPETTYWVQALPPLGDWCYQGGFFGMLESPRGCPQIECIPCSFYGNWPIAFFFPELARSQLVGYRHLMKPDGQVPFMIGEWGPPDMLSPRYDWQIMLNGPCYVMMLDRLWQQTGDLELVRDFWPSIKTNLTMTMNLRPTPEGPISMPSDNRGMEWFEWGEWAGMVSHAGGIRLATLKIAERMARALGDAPYADQCRGWFDSGSKAMEEKMWAGDYYLNFKEEETGKLSDAVMAYQLDGEWVARLHGVGGVFQNDRVPVALKKIRDTCTTHVVAGAASFASKDGQPLAPGNKVAEYGSLAFFLPEAAMLGMTYIQSGEREYGTEFVRRAWEQMVLVHRHPWDLPNMMLGETGERHFGTDYYQNMVLWTMPGVLAGQNLAQSAHSQGLVGRVLQAAKAK